MDDCDLDLRGLGEYDKALLPYKILLKRNFIEKFQIPLEKWANFTDKLRTSYNKRKNPFHYFDHGITVMHGCYYISTKTRATNYLDDFQQFALIFSGLCHDTGHRAKSNLFEINSKSKLAVRYSDNSPLEQHHLAKMFKFLCTSSTSVLENLTMKQYF